MLGEALAVGREPVGALGICAGPAARGRRAAGGEGAGDDESGAGGDRRAADGTVEQGADHDADLSVTVVAATVPSLPVVPVTTTVAPAFTSEIDVVVLTVVVVATLTLTTLPSEVAT